MIQMRMACSVILGCSLLGAQSLRFEAASVKGVEASLPGGPSRTIVGGPGTSRPGQIAYNEQSLKNLVFLAYAVPFYQLSTPDWMDEEYFNVVAKIPAGASKDDVRVMLQNLLAERFRLKVHRETREMQGYALTVGSNGAKLKQSPPSADAAPAERPAGTPKFNVDKDGFIVVPAGTAAVMTLPSRDGITRVTGSRQSVEGLCGYLSRQLQQPVSDQTGLKGLFDFHLWFVQGNALSALTPSSANTNNSPLTDAPDPAPTLIRAVESQLGLRLDARKVPVDAIVIDHMDRKPAEN
jgi:uncharacterized protein (TIGR03435 family)